MAKAPWAVTLTGQANRDVLEILKWTANRFGDRQADHYALLLDKALDQLRADPLGRTTRRRDDDIGSGWRTLHIRAPGRHLLVYRIQEADIVVVRILHDSMDIAHHLPSDE